MSVAGVSQSESVAMQATLLGIATPLDDLSIHLDETGFVLATVSVHAGVLSADLAPGATVRGSGSDTLWLSGSASQVNAKLASLTYRGNALGRDDVSLTVVVGRSPTVFGFRIPLNVIALNGAANPTDATVSVSQGTLTLSAQVVDGPTIAFSEPAGSQVATTGILINTIIGAQSTIAFRNDNGPGALVPRLAIAGEVELDGVARFTGDHTAVTLASGAIFRNEGSILIEAHAAQFTGTGRLVNDGVIRIEGDRSAEDPVRIDTALDGTGRIMLNGGAALAINSTVAATETIELQTGANTLTLARPSGFAGTITGFSLGERIVLEGMPVTGSIYSRSAEANTGTLTLLNDQRVIGTMRFSAAETATVFQLATDAAGNAVISLKAVSATASVDVFRFFDAHSGAQLLTQNEAERDAILASRSDLHFEGVGLHAVDPARADANIASVYRFFDTRSGTHFMTANASERDTIVSTRPDLVWEEASTLLEHATAQDGDVAVYRFFDRSTGAHFFTADAGERAAIIATRPDMASEGVAFYAPG